MSTFAQRLHTPRYLQQQIHQTLQLTHTPPSALSLRLHLHLSEKHRRKPKTNVNDNELSGSEAAFSSFSPWITFFFPTPLQVNNSTFLNTDSTKTGWLVLTIQSGISTYGEGQTDLEGTQLWDNQRNSMWQQGEQELHSQCPFNTCVLQQSAHRWKLRCAGCSTTAAPSTSGGTGKRSDDASEHLKGKEVCRTRGQCVEDIELLNSKKKITSITDKRASSASEPWAGTSPSVLPPQWEARKANTGKWALARKGLFEGFILPGELTPCSASRKREKQENTLPYPLTN